MGVNSEGGGSTGSGWVFFEGGSPLPVADVFTKLRRFTRMFACVASAVIFEAIAAMGNLPVCPFGVL